MDENRNALTEYARSREERLKELDELLAAPEILGDGALWRSYARERDSVVKTALAYRRWTELKELRESCLTDAATLTGDKRRAAEAEADAVGAELDEAYSSLLLSSLPACGARNAVIVEIRASGAPSGEFASALYAYYSEFAREKGFALRTLSSARYESGGHKEITLRVEGEGAYEYLCRESGVQRAEYPGGVSRTLVTAAYPARDERIYEPREEEIRIELFHSGGAGGQNVNKVETAVRARHLPTGIFVVCQDERSQSANRNRAVSELTSRVRAYYHGLQEDIFREGKEKALLSRDRIRVYDYARKELRDSRLPAPLPFRNGLSAALAEALALLRLAN